MKKIHVVLFLAFLYLFPFPFSLFSESNFSFRVAPQISAPIGLDQLETGMGAMASIDWTFLTFAKKFDVGVTAGGAFSSLSVQTGDPLSLIEGTGGVMLRYRPLDRWAFRTSANYGGYQYTWNDTSSGSTIFSFSLGAEFHLSPYFSLFADGAYTYRPFSDANPLPTIGGALGVKVNLSEAMTRTTRVQLERTEQHNIFPVSWAWYENNPIAEVSVTNNEKNAITNAELSFFIESYMSEPWTFAVIKRIASGETIQVPVTALFNESLITLSQNINANGILQVEYRSLGSGKETATPVQMTIFQRNTMSWDDDRRAAAFVSPRDYSALVFAKNIEAVINGIQTGNTPKNVIKAIAVFEALRLYRINYVVDPSTPYSALSENTSALDNLKFPYETLYYRGGECDDLSILLCSMLEALGVETAFVTVPGHIYTAFEVGDAAWLLNDPNIIERNGKRWIPLEATVTSRGFAQGWTLGLRQWRNAGDKAELFPIRECWTIYPSVTVPASGDNPPEIPNLSSLAGSITSIAANYRWTEQQAQAAARELERRNAAATAQRIELAQEINTILEELDIEGTTAEVTSDGVMIRLSNIQFLANSFQLTETEIAKINDIAEILKPLSGRKIQVTGHTADTGNEAGERRTSLQRARAVASLLVSLGAVSEINVIALGMGAEQPIADNSTAEGMAANRRVEITIME